MELMNQLMTYMMLYNSRCKNVSKDTKTEETPLDYLCISF